MIIDPKELITKKLEESFVELAEKYKIENPLDIRIKIKDEVPEGKTEKELAYYIMDKGKDITKSDLKEILQIGIIDGLGLKKKVGGQLRQIWDTMIEEYGHDMHSPETTDVRIAIQVEGNEKVTKIYAFDNGEFYDEIIFETE